MILPHPPQGGKNSTPSLGSIQGAGDAPQILSDKRIIPLILPEDLSSSPRGLAFSRERTHSGCAPQYRLKAASVSAEYSRQIPA